MARARSRGSQLVRLFDAAPQPLYIVDADYTIVFCNLACRRWLGPAVDELPGRRCAYHSRAAAAEPDALAAELCPPPGAFTGESGSGVICHADGEQVQRRRARFLRVSDGPRCIALVVIVDEEDLPDGAEGQPPAQDTAPSESEQLHEQLRVFRRAYSRRFSLDRLAGASPALKRARAQATLAAECRWSVAVIGPSGAGRQQLAKTIHFGFEPDRAGRLIPLDCSVLGGDLISSTVTALAAAPPADTPGRGTLLLNGAETIPPEVQADLARVLFDRSFPFRVIATCACRLVDLARRGEFHEGLALGLSTIEIELPPLAARREDIPMLAQLFLEDINASGAKQVGGFSSETLDMLAGYAWPGNVDELAAVVAEAHQNADGAQILARHLPNQIHLATEAAARPRRRETTIQLDEYLAQIERELIERAMRQAKGNKTKAARLLGLNRPRLYRRLLQLGLIEAE